MERPSSNRVCLTKGSPNSIQFQFWNQFPHMAIIWGNISIPCYIIYVYIPFLDKTQRVISRQRKRSSCHRRPRRKSYHFGPFQLGSVKLRNSLQGRADLKRGRTSLYVHWKWQTLIWELTVRLPVIKFGNYLDRKIPENTNYFQNYHFFWVTATISHNSVCLGLLWRKWRYY